MNQDPLATFREMIVAAASDVLAGKLSAQQANAFCSLSAELHKSLKIEYMGRLLEKDVSLTTNAEVVRLLEAK